MTAVSTTTLLPNAGPLITLAYADALDLLLLPEWSVVLVDMVLHEVTRNETPTSARIARWVRDRNISLIETNVCRRYQQLQSVAPVRKANLGEFAIQEAMTQLGLGDDQTGVFLFEDHKIARTNFLLPETCRKVSTRAFLLFLEHNEMIPSAADVERSAVLAGRQFSRIRFPPD